MEIDKVLEKDEACTCNDVENSKCRLCGQPLLYVNSPFGSIPTLYLFDKVQKFNFTELIEETERIRKKLASAQQKQMKKQEKRIKKKLSDLDAQLSKESEAIAKEIKQIQKVREESQEEISTEIEGLKSQNEASRKYLLNYLKQLKSSVTIVETLIDAYINSIAQIRVDYDRLKTEIVPQLNSLQNEIKVFKEAFPNYKTVISRYNQLYEKGPQDFFNTQPEPLSAEELRHRKQHLIDTFRF